MTAQLELFATEVSAVRHSMPDHPWILWDILVLGVWVRAVACPGRISLAFSDSGEGDHYDGIGTNLMRCDEVPMDTSPEGAAELIATGRSETTWLRGQGPVGRGLEEFRRRYGR